MLRPQFNFHATSQEIAKTLTVNGLLHILFLGRFTPKRLFSPQNGGQLLFKGLSKIPNPLSEGGRQKWQSGFRPNMKALGIGNTL